MGDRSTATRSTPSSGFTAAVTSLVMRSFNGQPSIVIRTSTRTASPSIAMPREHADVLDRPADLGIQHAAECLTDLGFGDHRVLSGSNLVDTV